MDDRHGNPLISTKPSDSGLHVALHPLVLLTISDYVTRHAARQQQGPIVGALLGQQESRQISLEYAFECHTTKGNNEEILLHPTWFADRLQQFKDVHKSPPLDLVGWFTITPPSGPSPSQLGIHRQILKDFNESAVFLGFHPSQLGQDSGSGAKLPLTIYESIYEGENVIDADADRAMQLDGEEQGVHIRFRELPYSVETSDAEMIGVDFVARGGGNAMAIKESSEETKVTSEEAEVAGKKRKLKQNLSEETDEEVSAALTPEDEDVIASLSTRLNAVKTLESRIQLIKTFLESFQSASLEDKAMGQKEGMTSAKAYPILRNIYALISDLSLLTPQDKSAFAMETLAQKNDVTLLSLLGQLGENVKRIREVGKKSMIAESGKQGSAAGGRKAHLAMQSRFDDDRDNVFANIGAGGHQMM